MQSDRFWYGEGRASGRYLHQAEQGKEKKETANSLLGVCYYIVLHFVALNYLALSALLYITLYYTLLSCALQLYCSLL